MRPNTSPLLQTPQAERRQAFSSPAPAPQQEIVIVESEALANEHAGVLRREYRVATTTDVTVALQYVTKSAPALVVADIDSRGELGVHICSAAQALRTPPTVLVITSEETSVPDVLNAGCDAVLLKPFAANLLYARIGRLMRTRSEQLRSRARQPETTSPFSARPEPSLATTNRTWPDTACPTCNHRGAVSFEFSSHRRAWYACLACKNVWVAKRQE
jgi:CheY-like chemotaxis protein